MRYLQTRKLWPAIWIYLIKDNFNLTVLLIRGLMCLTSSINLIKIYRYVYIYLSTNLMYIYTYVCTHTHICTHTCIHRHRYVCMNAYIRQGECVYTYTQHWKPPLKTLLQLTEKTFLRVCCCLRNWKSFFLSVANLLCFSYK